MLCCVMLSVNPEASAEDRLCAGLSAMDRGSPVGSQAGQKGEQIQVIH